MTTRFLYQAVGSSGRRERGSAEAATLEALAGSLADRGLILLDAESDAASDGRPVSSVTRSSTSGRQSLVRLDSLGRGTVARPPGWTPCATTTTRRAA